jgi:MerR family transcriptional regulator, light-induced transcriptional regulator
MTTGALLVACNMCPLWAHENLSNALRAAISGALTSNLPGDDTLRCIRLSFLSEAWLAEDVVLFSAYARWAAVILEARHIPKRHLVANFRVMADVLSENASPSEREGLEAFMAAAVQALEDASAGGSYLEGDRRIDGLARDYLEALLRTDRKGANELIFQSLSDGTAIRELYIDVFERTQYGIGRLWHTNRITVAQKHYCTAATQFVIAQLFDRFSHAEPRQKTIVAICVSGELHDIGLPPSSAGRTSLIRHQVSSA